MLKNPPLRKNTVRIRMLKEFAFNHLPKDSTLRDIILSEEDEISVSTFLARLPIWLKLLKIETTRSRQIDTANLHQPENTDD